MSIPSSVSSMPSNKDESIFSFFLDPAHIGIIIIFIVALIGLCVFLYLEWIKTKKEALLAWKEAEEVEKNAINKIRDEQINALRQLVMTSIDSQTKAVSDMTIMANEFRASIHQVTKEFTDSLGSVHDRITIVMGSLRELWGEHNNMLSFCPVGHAQKEEERVTRSPVDRRTMHRDIENRPSYTQSSEWDDLHGTLCAGFNQSDLNKVRKEKEEKTNDGV